MVQPGKPVTMGHEASGTIVALGSKVTKAAIGDRVALEPGFPCRRCDFCSQGRYNLCTDMKFAASPGPGPVMHGTLTRYFAVPEELCYKLPETVGLDEGVLVEPLAVAVHANRLVEVKPGHDVVVFGAGTVGVLSAAVAKEFGAAKIVIVDVNEERLQFARENGFATATYKTDTTLSAAQNAATILEQCDVPVGFDIVIEATGAVPCVHTGIEAIKCGGSYVQVGLGKKVVEFPLVVMSEKEIKMYGSFRYGPGDFALASSLIERKRIDVKQLITKVVPFKKTVEAWETARQGQGMKTLVQVE
jgi:D-xylulose reductase